MVTYLVSIWHAKVFSKIFSGTKFESKIVPTPPTPPHPFVPPPHLNFKICFPPFLFGGKPIFLPLTLCSHFCILSIVKIGSKPEDAMLLRGSKKILKCGSHDGQFWHSNCKRIYVLYMTPNKNGKVVFATY